MPRKATRGGAVHDDPKGMPAWKRQSVDRSLQSARARAGERSDRFVAATIELMREKGSTDFTVQDVVDRSKMSIRTFYNFFASKDDLLVAVHETVLLNEVVPRLRARIEVESDPTQRIRAYIDNLFDLSALTEPVARALTTYYNRLAESRPAELDRAFKPQVDLVVELVENAAKAGVLRTDLGVDKAAHLLFHTVLAAVHARILGSGIGGEVSADELWQFCAHGLGARTSEGRA